MKRWIIATLILVSTEVAGAAAGPYAGEQTRAIKALSATEVRGYLAGEGLGYAKAGELNHYPGPRHVLDLAKQLSLTTAQRARTRAIFTQMHAAAVTLGKEVVAAEGRLNAEFVGGTINDARLSNETASIAALEGRLRAVHLSAHLAMRQVLTAAQSKQYDRLRGYTGGHSDMQHMKM